MSRRSRLINPVGIVLAFSSFFLSLALLFLIPGAASASAVYHGATEAWPLNLRRWLAPGSTLTFIRFNSTDDFLVDSHEGISDSSGL